MASTRRNDLASRAFSQLGFRMAWIVFLMTCVTKFWWIRDAMLVSWVYGWDAYRRGFVRVLPGKPVRFSNGKLAPTLPDVVTGAAFFLAVTFGSSLLLVAVLRGYERWRANRGAA